MNNSDLIKNTILNATNTLAIQADLKLPFEPSPEWCRLYLNWIRAGADEVESANRASEQYDEIMLGEREQ